MFGWFKSKAQKQAELQAQIEEYVRVRDAEVAQAMEVEKKRLDELKEAARISDEERVAERKASNKPWYIQEVIDVDENGRVAVHHDWNDAWIDYLRNDCGFQGDEDHIVVKWAVAMTNSMDQHKKNDALDLFHTPGYEDEDVSMPPKKLN